MVEEETNSRVPYFHIPVLLNEAIDALQVKTGQTYIDATLGGGSYSQEIIKRGGNVLAIDLDPRAIEKSQESDGKNFKAVRGNHKDLTEITHSNGIQTVSGIVYDLGLSSDQLQNPALGLSFNSNDPLDMRLDQSLGVTAADLVNGMTEEELVHIFEKYGEEMYAKKIARVIVSQRLKRPIKTTGQLTNLISKAVPARGNIHPATRVFQALRIVVNDALGNLESSLNQAMGLLMPGGRLVVVSFHSLEDAIVKALSERSDVSVVGAVIRPSFKEVADNPRSRSAKLRTYEKKSVSKK